MVDRPTIEIVKRSFMADSDHASWSFTMDLKDDSGNDRHILEVPDNVIAKFREDGFVVLPNVLPKDSVHMLNDRLEEVLRGRFDREQAPDKIPRRPRNEYSRTNMSLPPEGAKNLQAKGPLGFTGNTRNVKVLQLINVHKADATFRKVACHELLGQVVAAVAGWPDGARLAQDQVWAKPPRAPSLTFHRDAPYFMFTPNPVVTVWIALDDMKPELGPLEYARGSHKWGDGRIGGAQQFFSSDGGHDLLRSAALAANEKGPLELITLAGLSAGGISLHDGRTWHGSGKNQSWGQPRRGLGLHYVPANVRFTADAAKSRLWKSYVDGVADPESLVLPIEDFPIVWQPPVGSAR